ncbi:MAG TPA: chromate transporter [Clostridiales bacterium]|nr:chromate transporter [Clostridiales bacterium]
MNIYLDLFLSFFKIGLFTIGGGYAMIPLISSTVVDKGWISEEMLINFIGISESTPGPFAINIGTFVGYETGGLLGVFCTALGLFLPSFIIILLIFYVAKKVAKNVVVQDAMTMVKPVIPALILTAFITIAISSFTFTNGTTKSFNPFNLIWGSLCFVVLRKSKKIHPILIIIASAIFGIVFYGFIFKV